MKKITVPRNKCLLDVIAEMGEQSRNAWHFLPETFVVKTLSEADKQGVSKRVGHSNGVIGKWNATKEFPETEVVFRTFVNETFVISKISADDIAFTTMVSVPEEVYYYEMQK